MPAHAPHTHTHTHTHTQTHQVLRSDTENTKALFRRAQALQLLGNDEDARTDLVTAATIEVGVGVSWSVSYMSGCLRAFWAWILTGCPRFASVAQRDSHTTQRYFVRWPNCIRLRLILQMCMRVLTGAVEAEGECRESTTLVEYKAC